MAKDVGYKGQFATDDGLIKVELTLVQFEEEGVTVIYAPSLDVYGYGYDEKEARHSFNICIEEFLEEVSKKNALAEELKKLGWKVEPHKNQLDEPSFKELINKNKELETIMENLPVSTTHEEVNLRMPA